jgi:cobalt-zinc-cadmium efflux system membrane fusion protein
MAKPQMLVGALAVFVLASSCSSPAEDGERSTATASAATPKRKAVAEAADGMCAEHGVLEAICTKCHPTLIPVFKAKGDWCEEHGFPESVCPICHPERGGRPKGNVDVDNDGPADGTKVTLKDKSLATAAGIETVKAIVNENGPGVSAVVRIVYDAGKVGRINARASGVVRELKADIGTRVEKGQALAVIDSASVGQDRSKLLAARARVTAAESAVSRETSLHERGIAARKSVEQAVQERDAATAELAAAQAALRAVGGVGSTGGAYVLTAPLAGVVVRRDVAVGQTIDPGPTLFEVVDASLMWAEIEVAEHDLAAIKPTQTASIEVDALPGRTFTGKVDYIAPEIDPRTRTAHVRVALANEDASLRANMFGKARIAIGADRSSVMVPRTAVQRAKDVQLVFVKIGDGQYEARRVKLGLNGATTVEITKGVAEGEEVVTTGSFLLKTETLPDAIGAGCCD